MKFVTISAKLLQLYLVPNYFLKREKVFLTIFN